MGAPWAPHLSHIRYGKCREIFSGEWAGAYGTPRVPRVGQASEISGDWARVRRFSAERCDAETSAFWWKVGSRFGWDLGAA